LITQQDKEFWKILDMFEKMPAESRIKLILIALDIVEIKMHVENKQAKMNQKHIPIIPVPKDGCDKEQCDMGDCKDTECPTLVHVEVKNRLALMDLRDWFFKFAVVSGTLMAFTIVIMIGTGVELPEGILHDIIDGTIELIKLIITS
jgi:hypothetical protein